MSGSALSRQSARGGAGDIFPPKAYILGAPKCGTSALARYLSEHPQVAFSHPKEIHFFADDLPGLKTATTLDEYRARFSPASGTRLLMEGSVWYLYSGTAVSSILRARPDALFIVMLRNPVKMIASLHRQLIHALDEDEADLRTAWHLSGARARGERIPRSCRAPATLIYTRTAAFAEMLGRLFAQVERRRCLVLFQEEMQADTSQAYRLTLDFLGLDDDRRQAFPRVNEANRFRSRALQYLFSRGGTVRETVSRPLKGMLGVGSLGLTKRLKRMNTTWTGPAAVPADLADEIARHYAPDMLRVADLLGRDIPAECGWPLPANEAARGAA